jgi:hypothetical protein
MDINSDIDYKRLIDGLRSGVSKNNLIKEILLFYNHKFYSLPNKVILSKNMYNIFKSKQDSLEVLLNLCRWGTDVRRRCIKNTNFYENFNYNYLNRNAVSLKM